MSSLNTNLTTALSSTFTSIVNELRERKLWPVAVALVVALVAIPVLLTKKAHSVPVTPPSGLPIAARSPLASVTLDNTPSNSRLTGAKRDPFTQQKHATTTTGAPTLGPTTTSGASGLSGLPGLGATGSTGALTPFSSSGGGSSSGGASSGGSSGSPIPSTPSPAPPGGKHPPAPATLSPTESYQVSFAITNPSGGLDTIDPLERLSILPNQAQPLMVELGVLKGGRQVLFAVEPGTLLAGPGACIPGPIDCEILSLGVDQTEDLGVASENGAVQIGLFAVTGINVAHHPSVAAAQKARQAASAAGRKLLSQSSLDALSLFPYKPSLGALVDLRNLSAGGS